MSKDVITSEFYNEKHFSDCVIKIVKFYKDRMMDSLKKALEPWEEEFKKNPLEIRISLGEM